MKVLKNIEKTNIVQKKNVLQLVFKKVQIIKNKVK
jgi:hypothetical protein